MITRKLGKLVRGKATPFQLMLACVLGGLLGAVPGFAQAPGLILFLFALLLVLNANLGIAALVGSLSKLVSLIAMPVQFEIGRILLDGPTEGLFRAMVNTPVLAWFGFEYYAVTGGLVLGIAVGLAATVLVLKLLSAARRRLIALESKDPEERSRVQKAMEQNKLARIFIYLFFGKKSKKSYEELSSKKIGNPIRIVGVVIVVLFAGLLGVLFMFFQEPLITASLKNGLEKANGATVDVGSADVDLGAGKIRVTGLAMADPESLSTDLLRAQTLTADLGSRDLLTRRFAFDLIEVTEASSGMDRASPGVLIGDRPKASVPDASGEGEGKTLDDYLDQAEQLKERLRQLREWLEKVQSDSPDATDPDAEEESYRDRLRRQVAAMGYANVRAEHLIDGAPTVLIRELKINGLTLANLEGEILDIQGTNLATQPNLLQSGRPLLDITSRSGNLAAALSVAAQPGETSTMTAKHLGFNGDDIGAMLAAVSGEPPVAGGTVDFEISLSLVGAMINGTLDATFHDSTLQLLGNATHVDRLTLPIGLSGPIDAPKIEIADEALKQALIDAGKAELANQITGEAGKLLDDALGDNEAVDDVKDAISDGLGGLFGGNKKDDDGG